MTETLEQISEETTLEKIKRVSGKFINLKVGVPVGLAMACLAAYSHKKYGISTMALVGARHFFTSSLIGSLAARTAQYGASYKNPAVAWTLGMLYPAVVANGIILSAHYATGTPEPLRAIAIPALIGTAIINPLTIYLTRSGRLK